MKKLISICLLAIITFTILSCKKSTEETTRTEQPTQIENAIVVYGIAYFKECNSEVPKYYKYKLVDSKNEVTEKKHKCPNKLVKYSYTLVDLF